MDNLLFALWFFLPAGAGNSAPIIAAHLPYLKKLNYPMDFNARLRGRRLLGEHKTWRGVASGILVAAAVVYIQQLIFQNNDIGFLQGQRSDYLYYSPLLLGFLFGFGALAGDAIKSFAKRQFNINPGQSWFPFDQLDYIFGGCLAVLPVAGLSLAQFGAILFVWFVMHLVFSFIGYRLGLKSSPI